jgi:hypothetical protein
MNVKEIFGGVFGESKAKHTPGKWKFNSGKTALLSLNEKMEHRFVFNMSPYNSVEPSSADAHLIEAAPDLLECLHMMAAELAHQEKHGPRSVPAWLTNMYAQVTAKARGES